MKKSLYALLPVVALLTACAAPDAVAPIAPSAPSLAVTSLPSATVDTARLSRLVDQMNASLAASGQKARVGSVSFFTVGLGVPTYRRLRFGAWPDRELYVLVDRKDYTGQLPAASIDGAVTRAYQSWDDVARGTLSTQLFADPSITNPDVFDVPVLDANGKCVNIFDPASFPVTVGLPAHIVIGGWLPESYFENCIGSKGVIGLTLTLVVPDENGDGYSDILYVEQYYNEAFRWVTSGAQFLGPTTDLESILIHEDGHAIGLDHFGGLNLNQPLQVLLKFGNLFDPAAVMNPGYAGGEQRTPLPTDVAAIRTLYNSGR